MTQTNFGAVLAAALLAFAGWSFTAVPSQAKSGDIDLRCKARGQNHISFHARFEERMRNKGAREKFKAEFEARPGGTFTSGQQISIIVDSVTVGVVTLTPELGGELSGELEFDSKPGNGHAAFPTNFPEVAAGTTVEAAFGSNTVLGCDLQ